MENKRASGGFVGTAIGTATTVIQGVHPEWFGSHPWILPASLLVLLASLLFWLTQYDWFQKILGLQHTPVHPQTPFPLPPDKIPSKLTIHSAFYGPTPRGPQDATGINVTGVLRGLIRGDAVAVKVENDIFTDPAFGWPKRLQVIYSYGDDPTHISIERKEHSFMVLPEDDFLKDQAEQAVTSLSRLFTPLQGDALLLSKELLRFVEELGPEPPPRYTAKQIEQMPSAQVEALARAQDGDFSEACEYHSRDGAWFLPRAWQNAQGPQNEIMARWNRLYPWYQKVSSKYALELKDRVETLRHRLIVEGLDDDALSLPIEGRDGVSNVRKIAATLWELAYKAGEKGIGSKNA